MTFLNPAVLFGLLAASIPVLLHLLNLRKLKRIEFSTLFFLKELKKQKIRKIKLKQWLLMVLRVLLIVFIVLTFARPVVEGVSFGPAASTVKKTTVFILDNTPSMEIVDAKGSYFNQAKEIIQRLLAAMQEGDEAAVVLISSDQNGERLATDLGAVIKSAKDAPVISVSKTLHEAVVKSARLLGASQNLRKEIFIISDFQTEMLGNPETFSDLGELLNENVSLYAVRFAEKEISNLSVRSAEVTTRIFEKDKNFTVSAEIENTGTREVRDAVVSLSVEGKRVGQKGVTLGAGETAEVVLEAPVPEVGFQEVTVSLDDDDLNTDNTYYLSIDVPERLRIAVLTDKPDDAQYVTLALRAADASAKMVIDARPLNQSSGINFSDLDAVFIIGSETFTGSTPLKNYLSEGGGILLMPGSGSTLKGIQATAQSLGLPVPTEYVKTKETQQASFGAPDYNHPVFTGMFSDSKKRAIESPALLSYFKLAPGGKTALPLTGGSPFLAEYRSGKGRVLFFAAAPVLSAGDFPLKPIFVPLIYKSLILCTARERGKTEYIAGEPVPVPVSSFPAGQITVKRPDGTDEVITLSAEASSFYPYERTDRTGSYRFVASDGTKEMAGVNLDPKETVLRYLSDEAVEEYISRIGFKGTFRNISAEGNIEQEVVQAVTGSELWKVMLFIAVLLAAAEMLVARSSKKESANL